MILSSLYAYPLVQKVLLVLINISAIVYLIFKSHFKERFETIEQASFEIILLTANIILLTLSILNAKKAQATLAREVLCFVVLMIIVIFNLILLGFFAVKGVIAVKEPYIARKTRSKRQKVIKV